MEEFRFRAGPGEGHTSGLISVIWENRLELHNEN